MYVLDCRNAFRALLSALLGAVERDVKKFAAGLVWWKPRTGADLNADLETSETADVSRSGCRIVSAILSFVAEVMDVDEVEMFVGGKRKVSR